MHYTAIALIMMPSFILLAKVIPPGCESTMMAISAAIIGFSMTALRNLTGVFINNQFVGVTKLDFEHFYILCVIQMLGSFIPLLYINYFVPSR